MEEKIVSLNHGERIEVRDRKTGATWEGVVLAYNKKNVIVDFLNGHKRIIQRKYVLRKLQ